jgi:hypothetical protein
MKAQTKKIYMRRCQDLFLISSLTCSSEIPQTVVNGGDDGTVLGMADLGEEDRAGQLSQGVSETDKESTAKVHYQGLVSGYLKGSIGKLTAVAIGKCRQESAKDHNKTSHSNGNLSAKVIGHVRTMPSNLC